MDLVERRVQMNQINPKFILRNYLLQKAIDLALKNSDFSEIERLIILLQNPFQDQTELFDQYGINAEYYASPTPDSFIEMRLSCSA